MLTALIQDLRQGVSELAAQSLIQDLRQGVSELAESPTKQYIHLNIDIYHPKIQSHIQWSLQDRNNNMAQRPQINNPNQYLSLSRYQYC